MSLADYKKMRKEAWNHYQQVEDKFIVPFCKQFDAKLVSFEKHEKNRPARPHP